MGEYGDVMTWEEFIHDVSNDCLIDYDGVAHPIIDGKEDTSIWIYPSMVILKHTPEYESIKWYNR